MNSLASITIDPVLIEVGLPALVLGIVLGAGVAWWATRRRRQRMGEYATSLEQRIKDQDALRVEREAAFEQATTRLARAFSDLSNQSLQSNSENFLRLAEQHLGRHQENARRELGERERAIENVVKPLRDALKDSQQQIQELEKTRSEAYGGIRAQLQAMQESQANLTSETQNLVKALRRPEVRGRWGEITLRRLVELAGMVEHCDFREQVHTAGDEQTIRPDMIVRMPDERELVVDVKTPLDAYLEAVEATDDNARQAALARHARNIREHVRKLSSKSYWTQFDRSPDFVILFIPGDQFLSAALAEEPDLIDTALAQQIILATPTSFVALLKSVAYGWRQLALAENAQEIRALAEDLYGRLGVFVNHLNKLGRQLGGSVESFNRAVGSLERKVLPGARKFVELGVHPRRPIDRPESLEAMPRDAQSVADEDADRNSPQLPNDGTLQ